MSEEKPKSAKFIGASIAILGVCAVAYLLKEPTVLWGIIGVGIVFNWMS